MACFFSFNGPEHIAPLEGMEIRSAHLQQTMLTQMKFKAGTEVPAHAHPHEQITLVIGGKLTLTVADQTATLRAGEGAVVPQNVTHSAQVLQETTAIDAWSPPREDYILE